jgi:ribulose-5-phosphate 4-epimerase/fuculose-1-phosphate aldolase
MPDTIVSIPLDVWKKAKRKEDIQAWLLSVQPELEIEFQEQEESLLYELSYLDCPKQRIPILLEFSDEEDDTEIISLVPQHGLFASGKSKEEAKKNLFYSMQEDYFRLKKQRDSLGKQLLLKLEFLESLF